MLYFFYLYLFTFLYFYIESVKKYNSSLVPIKRLIKASFHFCVPFEIYTSFSLSEALDDYKTQYNKFPHSS